jgi:hypothetical protein
VLRFLLDRHGTSDLIQLHDAVVGRVGHLVGEDVPPVYLGQLAQLRAEARAVEDVVPQSERNRLGADEGSADSERLRDPAGCGLRRVVDGQTELPTVAEQPPKVRVVVG